jgi:flagellar hook assembly protein FlgD
VFDDAPNALSYNALEWDGRDAEGDDVANGVYLYVIEAETDDAKATTSVGRMLRAK